MVTILPPFCGVLHTLYNIPSPSLSVFPAARTPAALPRLEPYKPPSGRSISAMNDDVSYRTHSLVSLLVFFRY